MAIFSDPSNGGGNRGEAGERVSVAEIEAKPIRVIFAAIPTLLAVADAAHGGGRCIPMRSVRAARAALAEHDLKALTPLVERPEGFIPECLLSLPDATNADADPTSALRRIAETAGDALLGELAAPGAPGVVGPWIEVAQDPGRWAIRYACALHRIWKATEAEIRGASAIIDREIERVGAAVARGTVLSVLGELYPGSSVDDGSWVLPAGRQRRLRLDERGLVLAPTLTAPGSPVITAYAGDALTHLAYPAPGAIRAFGDRQSGPSTLDALIGEKRSMVLRRLDRPQTIGGLAAALIAVPGTATHHVDALEAAGLVARERCGRHVLVHRTARGSALLALYETLGSGFGSGAGADQLAPAPAARTAA